MCFYTNSEITIFFFYIEKLICFLFDFKYSQLLVKKYLNYVQLLFKEKKKKKGKLFYQHRAWFFLFFKKKKKFEFKTKL